MRAGMISLVGGSRRTKLAVLPRGALASTRWLTPLELPTVDFRCAPGADRLLALRAWPSPYRYGPGPTGQ